MKSVGKTMMRRVALVLVGIVAAFLLWWGCMACFTPNPLLSKPYATVVEDASGGLLGARIALDGQWRFPPSDTVPYKMAVCLVQYEDKRFYRHCGVDALALLRAMRSNLSARRVVSGGSTLTMQLSRVSYGNASRTLWQKLREINRALYINLRYSKNEQLCLYVSHAPFGGNVVGLQAAAWRYYGRPANRLSWAESATLAVLPNAPSLVRPGRNDSRLLSKRNALLKRLKELKYIDETDYLLAIDEALPGKPLPLPNLAPHLLEQIKQQQAGSLCSTSLQAPLQQGVQALLNNAVARYAQNRICHAAVLVAEVESGKVLAYAGNTTLIDSLYEGSKVDVIPAPRSSGSVLKPFLYAALMQEGSCSPYALVADIPTNLQGFTPQNFTRTYSGAIPLSMALQQSLNVPMVRLLKRYGVDRFLELLQAAGFSTLKQNADYYGVSLILGGGEVSLWDLCGAYASMARVLNHYTLYNGKYNASDWHALRWQKTMREDTVHLAPPLLRASVIYQTMETLSNLNRPEEESEWQSFESMKKVAWKTGTSYGARDAWAVGVNAGYVVGVWVGNASGEGRAGLTGVGYAAPLMFSVFSLLPQVAWFTPPYDEMVQVPLCRQSGFRALPDCPADSVWVPHSILKSPQCPYHHWVHLSPDGRWQVNSSCCPVNQQRKELFFELPPVMAWYYKHQHVDYRPLPPLMPGCTTQDQTTFQFVYPEPNSVLVSTLQLNGQRGKFVFKVACNQPGTLLYWHLDNAYVGQTVHLHEMALLPSIGKHTLTVVDDKGMRSSCVFTVK